jgi:hypothetical protein
MRIDATNSGPYQDGQFGKSVSRSIRVGRVYRRVPVRVKEGKMLQPGEYGILNDGPGKYIGRVSAVKEGGIKAFRGLAFVVLTPSGFLAERWADPKEVEVSYLTDATLQTLQSIA